MIRVPVRVRVRELRLMSGGVRVNDPMIRVPVRVRVREFT